MREGERQVAPDVRQIRRDHVARYEWAAKLLPAGSQVLDVACGVGYGTRILAYAYHFACGMDVDAEAIEYAKKHYSHKRARFELRDVTCPEKLEEFDVAVCFETIEHIEDPRPLLKALRDSVPLLIASVPNEDVMPWRIDEKTVTAFHFRHYTKAQFEELLLECGWHVTHWLGQETMESEVEKDCNGRTLIAVAEQGEAISPSAPVVMHPSEKPASVPEHVSILGLGGSVNLYLELSKRYGGRRKYCDATWGINALGDVFLCDLIFHMDDVRIQEIRAEADPTGNIANLVRWIKTHPGPIITSRAHPDYPGLIEFPLEAVIREMKFAYFNSTAAYAIAYAIWVGVKRMSLFGMDFTYANAHHAEQGRACVEFWLGIAAGRGIQIVIPKTSSLMDACNTPAERLYGYDTVDVELKNGADGKLEIVHFKERASLPSAGEIEARYDHRAHPSPLLRGE